MLPNPGERGLSQADQADPEIGIPLITHDPERAFLERYSYSACCLRPSIIRELLRWAKDPEVIYMAGGLPSPETFPDKNMMLEITGKALDRYPTMMQYDQTAGLPDFIEILADHAVQQGCLLPEENRADHMIVTIGSQQLLDHVGKIFIEHGDKVIVPRPSYLGALDAFAQYGADFIEVPTDDEGIDPDALRKVLKSNRLIKFMYLVPTNDNPTGRTLSNERRKALGALIEQYELPTLEDDPYGELMYDPGERPVPLQRFAPDFVGVAKTFSKIFAPGFRIGYGILPPWLRRTVELTQQRTNLQPPTFTQGLAAVYMKDGYYQAQLPKTIDLYRTRRDVMLKAFDTYMPAGVEWTRPRGGMFVWATVPGADQGDILKRSLVKKVAIVPGAPFYATDGESEATFRVNFSNMPPQRIEEGIRRFSAAIQESREPNTIFAAS